MGGSRFDGGGLEEAFSGLGLVMRLVSFFFLLGNCVSFLDIFVDIGRIRRVSRLRVELKIV